MKTKVIIELSERWLKVAIGHKLFVEPMPNAEPSAISAARRNACAAGHGWAPSCSCNGKPQVFNKAIQGMPW